MVSQIKVGGDLKILLLYCLMSPGDLPAIFLKSWVAKGLEVGCSLLSISRKRSLQLERIRDRCRGYITRGQIDRPQIQRWAERTDTEEIAGRTRVRRR